MNPDLLRLHAYPFQRFAQLTRDVQPPPDKSHIALSLGEPRHPVPDFVARLVASSVEGLAAYPSTRGGAALREAIADWANRRYGLRTSRLDPERHVLPTCGSREALFSVAHVVIDRRGPAPPVVMMPNPCYPIYEGAALASGAEPWYLNTVEANGYLFEIERVPAGVWARTQLLYLCTPANPTGAVLGLDELQRVIELADRYDFVIASDECYSEIYFDETKPPPGLLAAAEALGVSDFRRCLVFQSLSKRSNLPGLRAGFVAGDGELIARYLRYRAYHGCTPSSLAQAVSIEAWRDEAHVRANRARYRTKFDAVLRILDSALDVRRPPGAFYLWARTPVDEEQFSRELFAHEHVSVLPGTYLSRAADGVDPGARHVRMALVGPLEQCVEAAERIRRFVGGL